MSGQRERLLRAVAAVIAGGGDRMARTKEVVDASGEATDDDLIGAAAILQYASELLLHTIEVRRGIADRPGH